MADEVISYLEMCNREGLSLQKGMNFRSGKNHSVILMSTRRGAPYRDEIREDGTVVIYEGHDIARSAGGSDPKTVDQPDCYATGSPTENGKFFDAARAFENGQSLPEKVRVYEKLRAGIWSYNGMFHLTLAWRESDGVREVFKFRLDAVQGEEDLDQPPPQVPVSRRIIPSHVKLAVWNRDGGKCVQCGSTENLHFDHIIPYSKGGASDTEENVQLLCGRHNLQKHDHIT